MKRDDRERKSIEPRTSPDNKTSLGRVITYAPAVIIILFAAFLLVPATQPATLWMLEENHPVEMLTSLALLAGAMLGLISARRSMIQRDRPIVFGFYALLSFALFFAGMEEISWGQQLLGFDTPAAWRIANLQGETNLHNVSDLQGRSEVFRLTFGFGGLVGVWLYRKYPSFRNIGSPVILLPWFVVISLHAGIDLYNDYFPITERVDFYVHATSELIEMLIGFAGFLYFTLNSGINSFTLRDRRAA